MLNDKYAAISRNAGLVLAEILIGGLAATAAAADAPRAPATDIHTVILDSPEPSQLKMDGNEQKLTSTCLGTMTTVDALRTSDTGQNEKTTIIICSNGISNAEVENSLDKAIVNIDKNDEINASTKADLKLKLRANISRLRPSG